MDIEKCKYCGAIPSNSGSHHKASCPFFTSSIKVKETPQWKRPTESKLFYELGFGWTSSLSILNALAIPLVLIPLIIIEPYSKFYSIFFCIVLIIIDSLFFIRRKDIRLLLKGVGVGLVLTIGIVIGFYLAY